MNKVIKNNIMHQICFFAIGALMTCVSCIRVYAAECEHEPAALAMGVEQNTEEVTAETDGQTSEDIPIGEEPVETIEELIPDDAAEKATDQIVEAIPEIAEEQPAEIPPQETDDSFVVEKSNGEVSLEETVGEEAVVFIEPETGSECAVFAATTIPPTSSAAPAPDQTAQEFVERMYREVLNRESDPEGLQNWTNALLSGDSKASDIVLGFFGSDEYKNKKKSNEELVTDFYGAMLGREPDAAGYTDWKEKMDAGMTYYTLAAGFVGSTEFQNLCNQYQIQTGSVTSPFHRDDNYERTAFVGRLYNDCLGRNYDTQGLEDWCAAADNGSSAAGIAGGFVFSEEYKNKHTENDAYVEMLYHTFLGRSSDKAGKADWTDQLNYSHTRESVFNGFLFSPEFAEKSAKAGLAVGDAIVIPDNTPEWQYNVEVLRLCNEARAANGVHTKLTTRQDLWEDVAVVRAKELQTEYSHTRPDVSTWRTAYDDSGVGDASAELIGRNMNNAGALVNTWMSDPTQRAYVLSAASSFAAGYNPGGGGFFSGEFLAASRAKNEMLDVRLFGATPDDDTDDTDAINAAIQALGKGSYAGMDTVYIPSGRYMINGHEKRGVKPLSNTNIVMDASTVLKAIPNSSDGYEIIQIKRVDNVSVTGGQIIGERHEHNGTVGEYGHGIGIYASANVTISSVTARDCYGDGIYLGIAMAADRPCSDIYIRGCQISDNRRNNISIVQADNVTIDRCKLVNAYGKLPQCGICIEPNEVDGIYKPNNALAIRNTSVTQNRARVATYDHYGLMTVMFDNYKDRAVNRMMVNGCTIHGDLAVFSGNDIRVRNTTVNGTLFYRPAVMLDNVTYARILES